VAFIDKKEFAIITGTRQTGKSTLLKQVDEHCKKQNLPTLFINLENKNILNSLNESPLHLLSYLPTTDTKVYVFIDEIQYLTDPSNFLKLLYDEHNQQVKIFATGSSSFFMDKSFNDSLAGRKRIFQLYTCSFDEYLKLHDNEELLDDIKRIIKNKNAKSVHIDLLYNEFEEFLIYGGYPAIITENNKSDKVERLNELKNAYIKRDVMESGVKDETSFYNLFRILAAQSGNLVNINELSKTLHIKNDTVANYISILQKCFHIALVKPFYKNIRKEIIKMPKVFTLDTGLQNCLLNNYQPLALRTNIGNFWETAYYKYLLENNNIDNVYFWRTTDGNEIDFILPDNPLAIEVKYNKSAINEKKYKKFVTEYPDIPLKFKYFQPFSEDFFRD
jgi:predicted AAA+ superfamily ATPase